MSTSADRAAAILTIANERRVGTNEERRRVETDRPRDSAGCCLDDWNVVEWEPAYLGVAITARRYKFKTNFT